MDYTKMVLLYSLVLTVNVDDATTIPESLNRYSSP
jgi:hypothetical protein